MQREGEIRIPSGCAVSGVFSKAGAPICGDTIIRSISVMHDRSNGLGGGFAGYGIYPEYKKYYAFHIFYDNSMSKQECEKFLERHFDIINLSKIPTRKHPKIMDEPLIWRYFVTPLPHKLSDSQLDEREFVARCVIRVNTQINGAYIFSSGKNMGVFKAVGFPEDVGEFYRLVILPIHPAGWVGPIPLLFWIFPSSTTGKSPPMTLTAVGLKCSDTPATCRQILK